MILGDLRGFSVFQGVDGEALGRYCVCVPQFAPPNETHNPLETMRAYIEYYQPPRTNPADIVPILGSWGCISLDGRGSLQAHIDEGWHRMRDAEGATGFKVFRCTGRSSFEGVEVFSTL